MEIAKIKSIIEAILFSAGRPVTKKELILSLEISEEDIDNIVSNLQEEYKQAERGIEIIRIDNSYQMCTKKDLYEVGLKYCPPGGDNGTGENYMWPKLVGEIKSEIEENPSIFIESKEKTY